MNTNKIDWENAEWGGLIEENINADLVKQNAIKRIIKNNEIHLIKARTLSDLCKKPKPNEQFRIITQKQFNAYALILQILEETDIEEMYLALFRINQPTVESITDFIKAGRIKKATFVISDFFHQTKRPEIWAKKLRDFCSKNDSTQHVYVNVHAKVCCCKTKKNDYFIFEGSGNMTINSRIEQFVYDNNKLIYDFHKDWMDDLVRRGDKCI